MNRIKELRTDSDMKQQDLADRLKIARSVVSKYELGQVDLSTDTIRRLCEIFGVTADYLLGFSSCRTAKLSDADAAMVAAYHTAPAEIRNIVDTALDPYRQKKTAAAG